ncbi:helix-turn-helix transcriptional regulator [Pigmentiphaga kullae]|uniref:Helix-turn-helix protein n=1 Tax=Pigmentiphaga kullae TaxID=151784 RepID=A0A4Q7NNC7_9BURK|nr:helix-turn-helix transcriptional regulator [Pigmentiphaga kullae]RZS86731.1 helix-turn-helix protein [Pigmentiphaga kullae]
MSIPTDAHDSPHLCYCGGDYGRVSVMASGVELADHARDCVQVLVNMHQEPLPVRLNGGSHRLDPFRALVIHPRQTYAIPPAPGRARHPGQVGSILIKASPLLNDSAGPVGHAGDDDPVDMITLPGPLRADAMQLVAELFRAGPDPRAVSQGVRTLYQAAVARSLENRTRDVSRDTAVQASSLEERVGRDARAGQLRDLEDFAAFRRGADTYGVSERYFYTLFRRATRMTPRAYYNMRRLDAAFALLAGEAKSIFEITYDLGFSAPPHFTRFMKSNTGWTPSEYRRRVRGMPPSLRPHFACGGAAA